MPTNPALTAEERMEQEKFPPLQLKDDAMILMDCYPQGRILAEFEYFAEESMKTISRLLSALDASEAQVRELREALEPLAAAAKMKWLEEWARPAIHISDLRRAAALLAPLARPDAEGAEG